MSANREIVLNGEALQFIKGSLRQGNTLSRLVLENLDLHGGVVTTELPKNADFNGLHDLLDSIIDEVPQSEWIPVLSEGKVTATLRPAQRYLKYAVSAVLDFLKEGEERICIIENISFGPGSRHSRTYKSLTAHFQNELYHLLLGRSHTERSVETALVEASAPIHLNGFMTSLPKTQIARLRDGELTLEALTSLAQATQKMLVEAYDGDAFVIWHKNFGERP